MNCIGELQAFHSVVKPRHFNQRCSPLTAVPAHPRNRNSRAFARWRPSQQSTPPILRLTRAAGSGGANINPGCLFLIVYNSQTHLMSRLSATAPPLLLLCRGWGPSGHAGGLPRAGTEVKIAAYLHHQFRQPHDRRPRTRHVGDKAKPSVSWPAALLF